MPTAILQPRGKNGGEATKTITHNNARLYHEGGRTYEFVGFDASGNRIYRDTHTD
jgi:hypothetical protein